MNHRDGPGSAVHKQHLMEKKLIIFAGLQGRCLCYNMEWHVLTDICFRATSPKVIFGAAQSGLIQTVKIFHTKYFPHTLFIPLNLYPSPFFKRCHTHSDPCSMEFNHIVVMSENLCSLSGTDIFESSGKN